MGLKANSIYFPGFNGIRAWAAFLVVFVHFNQFAFLFGISGFRDHTELAGLAVTVFFVLSGFLITYLLLIEYSKHGTVKLNHFYIRRILRIWPVYYMVILVSICLYFLVDAPDAYNFSFKTLVLYLFFLPNYAYAANLILIPITPLWSVGVEEQFYLLWPWLFRNKKSMNDILKYLILFLLFYLILKLVFRYFENGLWYSLIISTRLDCMAIGGIAAWCIINNVEIFKRAIFSKFSQIAALLFFIWSILFEPIYISGVVNHMFYSLFAVILISNVGVNKYSLLKLENKFYNYCGKISYGFYCYHMLVIMVLSRFCDRWFISNTFYNKSLIFLAILGLNLILSSFSYYFFESQFIKMKSKFTIINSRSFIN